MGEPLTAGGHHPCPAAAPASRPSGCTVPAVTVRRAATTAMALASAGWPRPRAHADHSFGCGTADRADRPSLATGKAGTRSRLTLSAGFRDGPVCPRLPAGGRKWTVAVSPPEDQPVPCRVRPVADYHAEPAQ